MTEDETPRDYDREWTDDLSPVTQVRLGYSHARGSVTRFLVQLEYEHGGEWREVVRYDHDPKSEHGHDVERDGLHIDIYRDGSKYRTEYLAPPMPADVAFSRAEDHLAKNLEAFTKRFEQWHGIRNH